jgi:hypothetical protein
MVDPPRRTGVKLDDALDAEEASAVLAAAKGDRLEALAVLVLAVGVRQGEALASRWDEIDLDAGTLRVTKAKTDAGVRTVALPAFVVSALRSHRRRQAEARVAAFEWDDTGLVFPSTIGTRIDRRNILRWWHDLTIRAGVGRRRFHASRHTTATLMLNNGVPLEVVSATLGHAGLAITADVYAKVRPQLQRQAADAMEQVLGAGPAMMGSSGGCSGRLRPLEQCVPSALLVEVGVDDVADEIGHGTPFVVGESTKLINLVVAEADDCHMRLAGAWGEFAHGSHGGRRMGQRPGHVGFTALAVTGRTV